MANFTDLPVNSSDRVVVPGEKSVTQFSYGELIRPLLRADRHDFTDAEAFKTNLFFVGAKLVQTEDESR